METGYFATLVQSMYNAATWAEIWSNIGIVVVENALLLAGDGMRMVMISTKNSENGAS